MSAEDRHFVEKPEISVNEVCPSCIRTNMASVRLNIDCRYYLKQPRALNQIDGLQTCLLRTQTTLVSSSRGKMRGTVNITMSLRFWMTLLLRLASLEV
jgi:hypothetical protein